MTCSVYRIVIQNVVVKSLLACNSTYYAAPAVFMYQRTLHVIPLFEHVDDIVVNAKTPIK